MKQQTKAPIKICGITNEVDACFARIAGAAAIGMIFYPPSPRNVSLQTAARIVQSLGPLCQTVAVIVDLPSKGIEKLIQTAGINTLQFHGKESPEDCDQFNLPYFKVIRMKPDIDIRYEIDRYPKAHGILLDTYVPGIVGGTGKSFDWSSIQKLQDSRIIVAGGLTPETILDAMKQSEAKAFDVSSGVESSLGVKDHQKISQLFKKLEI